jgi:Zn-dependent protease
MLAALDFSDPLLWAVFIGWILSVVQYIDPVFSILFPAIIFLLGGVPLPGGVTYVRRDLIRSRAWQVAVSAAGPAMNFLIFLLLCLPLHPRIGLIDPPAGGAIPTYLLFIGAMAWLQMLAVLFNLVPVPPLDGFQIAAEFMKPETREKLSTPPLSHLLFFGYFFVLWRVPGVFQQFHNGVERTLTLLGFDAWTIHFIARCFNSALFGR